MKSNAEQLAERIAQQEAPHETNRTTPKTPAQQRAALLAAESEEQITLMQICETLSKTVPELRLLYHVPNGDQRSKIVAARLAAEGVKRGVPDLCLPVCRVLEDSTGEAYMIGGLYIELKRATGGRLSPEQVQWLSDLIAANQIAVRCDGMEEALTMLSWYLGFPRPKTAGLATCRTVREILTRTWRQVTDYRKKRKN